MENIDELYDLVKAIKSEETRDIIKDVVILDGIILGENIKEKENCLKDLESKYGSILDELLYFKTKSVVDTKTMENDVDYIKKINTILGNLKNWLIRIAGIELAGKDKVEVYFEKLKEKESLRKIDKILVEIDKEIIQNIK